MPGSATAEVKLVTVPTVDFNAFSRKWVDPLYFQWPIFSFLWRDVWKAHVPKPRWCSRRWSSRSAVSQTLHNLQSLCLVLEAAKKCLTAVAGVLDPLPSFRGVIVSPQRFGNSVWLSASINRNRGGV